MRVVERVIKAPEAFKSPGGWAQAVEAAALDERLDRLQGDSPWSFIDDSEVVYDRARNTVTCAYHVPLILPIRGTARG